MPEETSEAGSNVESRRATLPEEINTATRTAHTKLNRLITNRLPLALPPNATTADLYALGLSHFAPVYVAFETAWTSTISQHSPSELPLEVAVLLSSLIHLYDPLLIRSSRLADDLVILLGLPRKDVKHCLVHLGQDQDRVKAFVDHIQQNVSSKPHLFIAYAWTFYMALFNGGRWMRAQLLQARDSHWNLDAPSSSNSTSNVEDVQHSEHGLSFWFFATPSDGEDRKLEFKTHLADIEQMLTTVQREEIVSEAVHIFEQCVYMIEELDSAAAIRSRRAQSSWSAQISDGSFPRMLMRHIFSSGFVELLLALLGWIASWRWLAFTVRAEETNKKHKDD